MIKSQHIKSIVSFIGRTYKNKCNMKFWNFVSVILTVSLLVCCNSDDEGADNGGSTPEENLSEFYTINIQDEFTTPPAKVSVFYRVEDANGDPVPDLSQDDFNIFEKGRNDTAFKTISKDEADRVISDNTNVFKYNVMMLLDLSASVTNNHLTEVKASASQFVHSILGTNLNTSTRIGIFWFDGADNLHVLHDFTNKINDLDDSIDEINGNMSFDNSTDLYGAVIKGTELTNARIQQDQLVDFQSSGAILIFTDGTDQAARYTKAEAYETVDSFSKNINYYTVGLGNEIDQDVLETLGKKATVLAEDGEELTEKFTQISDLIYKEINSFYLFEYCTPKRDGSGINELRIELKVEERSGSKETTFDATGFRSGCELN